VIRTLDEWNAVLRPSPNGGFLVRTLEESVEARPADAGHWNLLTDLNAQRLPYAA